MNEGVIFRSGLAVVSLALALVRFYYGRLAVKAGGKISFKRAGKIRTALWLWFALTTASTDPRASNVP